MQYVTVSAPNLTSLMGMVETKSKEKWRVVTVLTTSSDGYIAVLEKKRGWWS